MAKKPKTIAKLKLEADTWFSRAVRLRDADKFGMVLCITCPTRKNWKEMHAGHFQSRRYGRTRYSEENVNGQCAGCNTFNAGEQYRYAQELDLKYGTGTAKKLEKEARKPNFKYIRTELEQVIADAKEQVKWYENNS